MYLPWLSLNCPYNIYLFSWTIPQDESPSKGNSGFSLASEATILNITSVSCWCYFIEMGISLPSLHSIGLPFSSVQFSRSVVSDSLQPHGRSTPGLPVHHQLLESTQTHVHRVSDAIQPSHPLLSPSPPTPNPSQHQSLFQWVNSSHEVAKGLEFQL